MSPIAFILYLAPAALAAVGVLSRFEAGRAPQRVLGAARVAAAGALGLSVASAVLLAIFGATTSPLLGVDGLGLSARLDALSVIMFAMVAFVGLILVEFSRNYVDGDARHGAFIGSLCWTVAAVLLLVTAGNLVQLVLAWIGTSLALHQLLVFYPERRRAVIAARKKFIVARLGDACLLTAVGLVFATFGTADIADAQAAAAPAATAGAFPPAATAAAILIVVAAALKSAAFPTHGWLIEVMETPTPVSALLHAGLINGGTFLVVRSGDLVTGCPPALQLLIIVGAFSALFASVVLTAQSSVKVTLAYSSAAHMGFMLMLCGLGAHSAAILHLVAHSFYKAHAFLSSGSIVEYTRHLGARGAKEPTPGALQTLAGLLGGLVVFMGIGAAVGAPLAERPASMALGAVFVMAIGHLVMKGLAASFTPYVLGRTALSAVLVALSFFGLEALVHQLLLGAVAVTPEATPATMLVMAGAVSAFAVVTIAQSSLRDRGTSRFWKAAYVHLRNGLYANTLFDRLVGTHR